MKIKSYFQEPLPSKPMLLGYFGQNEKKMVFVILFEIIKRP